MTPRAFFDEVILSLDPVAIVLGDNFSFGCRKSGNIDDLRRFCSESDIALHALGRTTFDHCPVSSTRIRAAIREGNIAMANKMLGVPYTLYGCVEHGAQRARTLGFPTANIHVPDQVLPATGVYATRVATESRKRRHLDASIPSSNRISSISMAICTIDEFASNFMSLFAMKWYSIRKNLLFAK